MVIQNFDFFNQFEAPVVVLCQPNGDQLYSLGDIYNKQWLPRYNSVSTFTFTAPNISKDGVPNEYYDYLDFKRLVLLNGIGYFMITTIDETNDGIMREKQITAQSLEIEINYKKVSLFKGTYKFYDILSPETTLLGTLLAYLPGWTVGSIDSSLWNIYRTFDVSDATIYNLLMTEIETAYQCVFTFDAINRRINAYSVGTATNNTDIFLSYDNLIEKTNLSIVTDEMVTALNVYGGGDLSINQVNPLGTNTIYNFSYYEDIRWMTQDLIDALHAWEVLVVLRQPVYANLLTSLKTENALLITKQGELTDLQGELAALVQVQQARISAREPYPDINILMSAKNAQISAKQSEMVSVQNTITNLESQLVAINTELSFTNNFTSTQMTDLSTFIIGNTYQDNNFIQTDTMTLVDIQNMAQALYDQAQGILSKVSQPRYTFTIDAVNFVLLEEFQTFTNQLNLGSIITTEIESGVYIYPVLLGLDINYDDPTQFTMTFGNRLRLDDSSFSFSDLFGNSTTQATNSSFNSENWGSWSNNYKDSVSTFITSALDASLNNVISSNNEEIKIDASGIRGRRLNPITNTYDPDQIWIMNNNLVFTNDNWNTAALALGKISTASGSAYGLVAEVIVGRLLAGNQLTITNENNNFVLDGNGATLTNANFILNTINGNNQILLDPVDGIKIRGRSTGSWVDSFYVDRYGNINFTGNLAGATGFFSGDITANSGHIGGWTINSVGLSDGNGNYINSNGNARIGLLTIHGSYAEFAGNIYANNLMGLLQANQIGSLNANVINAGVIRGIDIMGSRIQWPGAIMYSPYNGASNIFADNLLDLISDNIYLEAETLYLKGRIDTYIGAPFSFTHLNGWISTDGQIGKTGVYIVPTSTGSKTLTFTNGLLTTGIGAEAQIPGWALGAGMNAVSGNSWLWNDPNTSGSGNSYTGIIIQAPAAQYTTFGQLCHMGADSAYGGIWDNKVRLGLPIITNSISVTVVYTNIQKPLFCIDNSVNINSIGNWLIRGVITNSSWALTPGAFYCSAPLNDGNIYNLNTLYAGGSSGRKLVYVLGIAIGIHQLLFEPEIIEIVVPGGG